MARSMWNGSLLFGEVVIPVGIAPTRRHGDPSFKRLHRDCGLALEQQLACPVHGALEESEIVKGYELAPGQYVALEPDEIAEATATADDRSVELARLVPADELDELAVDASYYLTPSKEPIGRRAYVLLAGALRVTRTVALCRLTPRGSEWIGAVRPHGASGPVLILQRLVPLEDRAPAGDVEELLVDVTLKRQESKLARELAERLRGPIAPGLLRSEQRPRLEQLVEAKLAGGRRAVAQKKIDTALARHTVPVPVDLEQALTRSLRGTRKPRRKTPASPQRR